MADDDVDGGEQQIEQQRPPQRERRLRQVGSRRPPPRENGALPEDRQPPGGFGEHRITGRQPPPIPPIEDEPVFSGGSQQPVDDLDEIVGSNSYPLVLRVLAQRIQAAEQLLGQNMPQAMQIGQSLIQLDTRLRNLEPQVQYLSQQRAVAEMSLERHTRSQALDLAIKSMTDEQKTGRDAADLITLLADAFLRWMKASENH
jgi:hypothetical protein